jgi:hypothetical protein
VSARVASTGKVYQLDRQATPDEVVTAEDVKDADKLARMLARLLREVSDIKRRWWPRSRDYEDKAVVSGTPLRLGHGFNARVRWWVVDWVPTTPGDVPVFEKSTSTDLKTLVLDVGNSGTVSVRVEVAG